jgi:hypothetical protein
MSNQHSHKLTFHNYRDFDSTPLPELLTRIKIDLRRLFVTASPLLGHVALAPGQTAYKPSAVFNAKLRKLSLREKTIGYGPSKKGGRRGRTLSVGRA